MISPPAVSPTIRPTAPADLDQIVAIDLKVLAKARPEYWEMKMDLVAKRDQIRSLVAEQEGRVVGFIIGGVSRWEYGMPENIGWIDTIGVDPDWQRRGVARDLFQAMAQDLKAAGVETIYTFVKRRDWKLLKFFDNLGFNKGDMTHLELEL